MPLSCRRWLLATASVAVLAACGGGSSSAKKTDSTNAVASTVKATKGGNFCKKVAASYNEASNFASTNATATPDQLHQQLDKAVKDGQSALDDAPDEVKSDLQTIQAAVKTYADALAKAGYDLAKLGAGAVNAAGGFETPQFQEAVTHSEAYVSDHCGIDLGNPSTTTP